MTVPAIAIDPSSSDALHEQVSAALRDQARRAGPHDQPDGALTTALKGIVARAPRARWPARGDSGSDDQKRPHVRGVAPTSLLRPPTG